MRAVLIAALWLASLAAGAAAVDYPVVRPEVSIDLPRDHGAHPAFRVEWWYVTGWLEAIEDGKPVTMGFQVTFFRVRPGVQENNPSRFAASQILFAHAALSDPRRGRLMHAERTARAGFGLAQASEGDLDVRLDDWSMRREGAGDGEAILARVAGRDFAYDLRLVPTGPALLNGQRGFSQKAPDPRHSSHYYSLPQLAVSGKLTREGRTLAVSGRAWFDHEWSSEYLPETASGWDWFGINLADGGALMAFRMRGKDGAALWAGGTLRRADGRVEALGPRDVAFEPQREWTSPRTGSRYPVAMRVRLSTSLGPLVGELTPLFDDQELDSRRSTGAVYWEGAVVLSTGGKELGRGYLELTGYRERLRM